MDTSLDTRVATGLLAAFSPCETSIDIKVVNALTNLPVTANYSNVGNDHDFGHADTPNGEVLDHTVIFKQQTGVQWKSTKVQFYAKVKTDQTVLQVAKEVLSSRVSETQIDDLGTTTLACVAYPTTELPIGDTCAAGSMMARCRAGRLGTSGTSTSMHSWPMAMT